VRSVTLRSCSLLQPANPGSSSLNRSMQRVAPAAALILIGVVLAGCQTVAGSPRTSLYEPVGQSKWITQAKAIKEARAAKAAKAARAARARAATARAARARAARARAARAKAAQAAAPVRPAEANRPALGVKLLGDDLRSVLFQERLRGLCEIVKVYQLSSHSWRATCAKGGAFNIKVYPDGYMSLTRS
jgi:hypothetical protein